MKMFTYLLLNLTWLLLAGLWLKSLPKPQSVAEHYRLQAIIILYVLMVGFNTYLTSLAIVRYDWQRVLGIKIVSWPIEDIAYLVVALYIAPALYAWYSRRYDSRNPLPPASRSPHQVSARKATKPEAPTTQSVARAPRRRTSRQSSR